ncbi:response regulator transcription factor [Thalassotalea atypica]|uniref:response regulator transcription factor n=1 Tax=Thalassotalea atypica TaxID=2054316 RepID=UPI002572AAB9|nr:response regulator [Thalassotalea atypica]
MKVLIIEDDAVFSASLRRRLKKHGYQCLQTDNCSDALLHSRQYLPDIILLDMHLDGDSGLKIIAPMRNILPKAKIILLTGYASIATAVEAIKLGADDYLAKPIDTQTLISAMSGSAKTTIVQEQQATLSSEQIEWEHIQQVLKFNDGNVSAAARQLSMHRRTLQRKLKKRPSFQSNSI